MALLGDLIEVISGFAFKSSLFVDKGGLPLIRIRDVKRGFSKTHYIGNYSDDYLINDGDLLIGMDGEFNAKRWVGGKALLNQRVCKVIATSPELDEQYLYHFLPKQLKLIEDATPAVTVKHLSVKTIRNIEILIPPLKEQKRIAAILDKADAIRRKRQQAIALTDQLLRSAFLDMFGDPVTNPKGWKEGNLGDVIYFAKDGPHVSPKYAETGVPFLSTRHVKTTGVVWRDLKYISQEEAIFHWRKCKPMYGDVLYTKGGTTGIASNVDFHQEFAVWVHVALLRPNFNVANSIWLTAMLNSAYCYMQSQRFTHGATNKDLGLTRMIKIRMYIPPIEMQEKYVKISNKLKAKVEKYNESINKMDNLFDSLTQQAFNNKPTQAT